MDTPNIVQLFNHVINGNINAFNIFINENPNIDLNNLYYDGDNLLHISVKYRRLDFIKLLVNRIDINSQNKEHRDALLIAASRCGSIETYDNMIKYYDIIKYLILECRANCATSGMFGDTALIVVCRRRKDGQNIDLNGQNTDLKIDIVKSIVELLLANGADRNAVDVRGWNAELLARFSGYVGRGLNDEQLKQLSKYIDLANYIKDYQEIPGVKGCYEPGI